MEKLTVLILALLTLGESRSISEQFSSRSYHRFVSRPVRRLERNSDAAEGSTFGLRVNATVVGNSESPTESSNTTPDEITTTSPTESIISSDEITTTLATTAVSSEESVQPEYENIRIIAEPIKPLSVQPEYENIRIIAEPIKPVQHQLLENIRIIAEPLNTIEEPPEPSNHYTPYNFSYTTDDGEGNSIFREEYGDSNGTVRGRYGYHNSLGLQRFVEYIADYLGYRAAITSNEPGVEDTFPFPANVVIKKNPVPENIAKIVESYNAKPIKPVVS